MKKLLAGLIVVACIFITSSAMAAGDKCIEWSYMWEGMTDYNMTYTWLYEDGSFLTAEGGHGTWEKFGGSFMLQYTDGCMPLYAGTKKQGFFKCTDGDSPSDEDNYYMIKGTNKKNCEAAMPIAGAPAEANGITGFSYE